MDYSNQNLKKIPETLHSFIYLDFVNNKIRFIPNRIHHNDSDFMINRIKRLPDLPNVTIISSLCGNKIKDWSRRVDPWGKNKYLYLLYKKLNHLIDE
jgi:hypothetical protein